MQKLELDGNISEFSWTIWEEGTTASDTQTGQWLVPVELFSSIADTAADATRLGLIVAPDVDFDLLASVIDRAELVAVNFPSFTDGRGFSIGRMIRGRFSFKKPMVAYGGFIRDQLFYLKRCGFDGFIFDETVDASSYAASLDVFSDGYQASFDQPVPLFRRR